MCKAEIVEKVTQGAASERSDAYRRLTRDWASKVTLSSATRIIDLTHPLGEETPVYPGDDPFERSPAGERGRDGYKDYVIRHNEHIGTHIDAPLHFAEGGSAVDDLNPQEFLAPLAVIDLRAKAAKDPDYQATPDDLLLWERAHGRLPSGSMVFLDHGWDALYGDKNAFCGLKSGEGTHTPGWGADLTALLIEEREVTAIGLDTQSLDAAVSSDFPVHNLWLGSGGWAVEGLANLGSIPPAGAIALVGPTKLSGGTGAPARVIAFA